MTQADITQQRLNYLKRWSNDCLFFMFREIYINMDGKKVYQIQINGIKESTDAVSALNKQLDALEQRIKTLESKNVKVNASSSGSKSTMDEEAKLAKQIEQIDAKREAYSKEIYQNYLAVKDVLKETVRDQQEIAAAERLQADSYSNTMNGIKEKLKDLKSVHFSTDISTDEFAKQTEEINTLTQKLKELEEAYGQFGRNVGNYQSAFDGISKVSVNMGGAVKSFDNLKQAAKALRDEMGVLEYNGKKDTKMYKQLETELERVSKAQLRLNSAMKDAKSSSKAMDDLLDTMESFTALGQVGQGFSTLFGFDNTELEQQIAKLVALQNVLSGIEKIRQQMNTKEGIGKWLAKGSDAVDSFVMKLTGAQKRMGMLVKDTRAASLAVQGLSTALKALGGVAVAGGLMLAMDAFSALIEDFKKWRNGGYKAGAATDYLSSKVESLNEQFDRVKQFHLSQFLQGFMTQEEYATDKTKTLVVQLNSLKDALFELLNANYGKTFDFDVSKYFGKSTNTLLTEFNAVAGKLDELENGLSGLDKWSHDWFGKFFASSGGEGLTNLQKRFQELGQVIAHDFMGQIDAVSNKVQADIAKTGQVSDATKREVENLVKTLEQNPSANSLFKQIDKFTDRGQYYIKVVEALKDKFVELGNSVSTSDFNIDPNKLAQLNVDAMKDGLAKQRAQIELNRKQELDNAENNEQLKKAINAKYNRQILDAEKSHGKEMAAAYADLENLRIEIMDEGWAKEKARLLHEQKEKIRAVVDSEKLVGARKTAIEALYAKKIKEAEIQWAEESLKIYEDLADDIQRVNREAFGTEVENALKNTENTYAEKFRNIGKLITEFNYKNFESMKEYYKDVLKATQEQAEKEVAINQESLDKQLEYDIQEENRRHDRLVRANGEYAEQLKQGKITKEQYDKLMEDEENAHLSTVNALEKKYAAESSALTLDMLDKKERAYSDYYTNVIAEVRKGQDEIVKRMNKAVITDNDKKGIGYGFGVIDYKATKANYAKLIAEEKSAIEKIQKEREQLYSDKDNLSGEYFKQRLEELDAAEEAANTTLKDLETKSKEAFPQFMQSIIGYVQDVVNSFQTIMQAAWDAQDTAFDKQQEELDKENDRLQDALDKQEDIIEQHKSKVDSIEDELATARGDRRQHLIDQINAEIEAERAAQKEKQRIEKEQEKVQKRQDELDKKRKKAEYERNIAQAIINGAMAVTMAAINTWPVPAIPMMALAASTTAAQLALMMSQKPYANGGQLDGGVAQGARHKDGGIPVLGGRASIEGGEFITNRQTTAKNVDLLEYINAKHRKLNIDDFIDFYSSGKAKKNFLASSPRQKFADGGVIPTLNNEYTFDDRLLTAFEDYSNREVVVSVVDINNRQAAVKNVQVLAGLTEE